MAKRCFKIALPDAKAWSKPAHGPPGFGERVWGAGLGSGFGAPPLPAARQPARSTNGLSLANAGGGRPKPARPPKPSSGWIRPAALPFVAGTPTGRFVQPVKAPLRLRSWSTRDRHNRKSLLVS